MLHKTKYIIQWTNVTTDSYVESVECNSAHCPPPFLVTLVLVFFPFIFLIGIFFQDNLIAHSSSLKIYKLLINFTMEKMMFLLP